MSGSDSNNLSAHEAHKKSCPVDKPWGLALHRLLKATRGAPTFVTARRRPQRRIFHRGIGTMLTLIIGSLSLSSPYSLFLK